MIKLLLLGIALYVAYKLFANDFIRKKKEDAKIAKEEEDRKISAGEMVQDPQCCTYVALDDSISVRDGEHVWHFCSYECRDAFLKKRGIKAQSDE